MSFTGRDEDIADEQRHAQRYTLSHLAHDLSKQTGITNPLRDWFPLSALSPFGDVCDLIDGPNRDFGQLKCGCHPNCGIGTVLFVNKKTKQMVPLLDFLDMEGILRDMQAIFDAGRPGAWAKAQVAASVLRHFDPDKAPPGFTVDTLIKQFMSQIGARHREDDAAEFEWRVLFVAGMLPTVREQSRPDGELDHDPLVAAATGAAETEGVTYGAHGCTSASWWRCAWRRAFSKSRPLPSVQCIRSARRSIRASSGVRCLALSQ